MAFLILANLLIKPFYLFGIEQKVQFLVGNAEYGYYYNIFNFTLILQFINDFGIQNYTTRTISQSQNETLAKAQSLMNLKLYLSLLYLIISICVAILWYGSEVDLGFILHICFNQILISLIFFLRSNIAGLGLYFMDSIFSILDRTVLILFMGIFIFIPQLNHKVSIQFFVNIQSASLLICSGSALFVLLKHQFKFSLHIISFNQLKEVIRYCFPFALIYLSTGLFTKADTIWIENILPNGREEAGIYASCFRLFDAMTIISLSFAGLMLAMFSKIADRKKELSELLYLGLSTLYIISLGLGLVGTFYSIEIGHLVNKTYNENTSQLIFYLCIAFIPASLNYIFGAFYQAIHLEIKLLKFYGLCMIISIISNILLIPYFGSKASAIIYIFVQGLLLILSIYSVRELFLTFLNKLRSLFIFSLLIFVVFWIFYQYIHINYLGEWFMIAIFSLIFIHFLKIVNFNEIKKIWFTKVTL